MSHAQKRDFVFRRSGRVRSNRRGRHYSRLLAAEVCASAIVMVIMLDTPCSVAVWKVLATHSIRLFSLYFPSCASPCTITFQLDSTKRRTLRSTFGALFFSRSHSVCIIPLNTDLNPICHLLALLGIHHILHVSRIRVNV